MGALASAPIQFEAACDVPKGGVLLALPALLAAGLLRHTPAMDTLPNGFYGIASIFLLLALMALARIQSIEQLRDVAPGEWGNLLGLDRIPEVRTLRRKLEILCQQAGVAVRWNTALAKEWIAGQGASDLVFYADGHVRVYNGDLTPLPRHYVARQRLCPRATTGYWINAMDGQPFMFVNKEVDPGLLATLCDDLVPWLKTNAPVSEQLRQLMQADPLQHRFALVFDREAYSPVFFAGMKDQHIAILTYHKYPGENWAVEEFAACGVRLAGGEVVTMQLAERGTRLSNGLCVREVRKLSQGGHQTSILSTNYRAGYAALGASMFARWSRELFQIHASTRHGASSTPTSAPGVKSGGGNWPCLALWICRRHRRNPTCPVTSSARRNYKSKLKTSTGTLTNSNSSVSRPPITSQSRICQSQIVSAGCLPRGSTSLIPSSSSPTAPKAAWRRCYATNSIAPMMPAPSCAKSTRRK